MAHTSSGGEPCSTQSPLSRRLTAPRRVSPPIAVVTDWRWAPTRSARRWWLSGSGTTMPSPVDAPPALGEVPERQQQPVVDTLVVRDRQRHGEAVRPAGAAIEQLERRAAATARCARRGRGRAPPAREPSVPSNAVLTLLNFGGALAEVAPRRCRQLRPAAHCTPTVRTVRRQSAESQGRQAGISAVLLKTYRFPFDAPSGARCRKFATRSSISAHRGNRFYAYVEYGGDRDYYLA